ncbi:BQ00720 family protein [Acuticoccus mangrovi]|uniref:DUF1150 domain-containing protein n=1 Tax=Acuticoccus mangrovi TaxID=2796142 RepID=A0A934MGB4_9HYPH|nr:DUF1150 domain-containing protein [Acuticoccus mangrovi]MBJ3776383.1 DUF1150 domain-containing protein [Acuticoccus mangrovi]
MTEIEKASADTNPAITTEMLATLGTGQVAYVRAFRSEEVTALFPNVPHLTPGQRLWALLSADGTPIVLADTPQAVLANAMENNLVTVSRH